MSWPIECILAKQSVFSFTESVRFVRRSDTQQASFLSCSDLSLVKKKLRKCDTEFDFASHSRIFRNNSQLL